MPDFDFDAFNHDEVVENAEGGNYSQEVNMPESMAAEDAPAYTPAPASGNTTSTSSLSEEEVDKW